MQPCTPRSYALAVPTGDYPRKTLVPLYVVIHTVHGGATVDGVAQADVFGWRKGCDSQAAGREPGRPRRCRPPRRNGRRVAQPTPSEPQIRLVARIMKSPEAADSAPELIRGSSRAGSPTWQRHLVGRCAHSI